MNMKINRRAKPELEHDSAAGGAANAAARGSAKLDAGRAANSKAGRAAKLEAERAAGSDARRAVKLEVERAASSAAGRAANSKAKQAANSSTNRFVRPAAVRLGKRSLKRAAQAGLCRLLAAVLLFTLVGFWPTERERVWASGELLANPGFEQVTSGVPDDWHAWDAIDDFESESDPNYVRTGSYSVRLNDGNAVQATGLQSAQIPVTAGKLYRASVYAMDVAGESHFYLEYWNSANQRIDAHYVSNFSLHAWNRLEIVREAPAGAVSATLLLYLHGTNVGTSYFDSASFQEVPVSSDPNFGFETVFDGKPVNWINPEGNGLYDSVTDVVYSGAYSVKLSDPSPVYSTGLRSGKLDASPSEEYRASVMNYNVSGQSQLYLEFWNALDERISALIVTNTDTGEWRQLVIDQHAPPGTAYATLLLYLHGVNVGEGYFDEASFGPAPSEPLRTFPLAVPTHPRLYFTSADIPALQARADDGGNESFGLSGEQIWTSLESTARRYLTETDFTIGYYDGYEVTYPLPPVQPDPMPNPPGYNGPQYPYWTAMSTAIQERLELLSLAYAVTEDTDFADLAKTYMLAMAEWDTWNDATSPCEGLTCLDTAHITLGVSMAYDVLYNELTTFEREQVETALEEKGLIPLYLDSRGRADHNIEMLRAVALGVGASVLLGKTDEAHRYLTRAAAYYEWYLDSRIGSGKQEGLLYTSYSLDNLMRAVDSVSRVTGLSEFIEHPFLNDFIVRWATYFLAPGASSLAAFSDSQYANYFMPTMNLIHNWLQDGHAGWYLDQTRPESSLLTRFLYFHEQPVITAPTDWPTSAVLDEIGWAALRSGWGRDDTLFAMIANDSRLGHNHHDQNSFQIATNRSWIAADPGYRDYSPGPGNAFTIRFGHSTIQVDGQGQSELGGGRMVNGMLSPIYDYIKGEAAAAYGNPKLETFDRHVVYLKPDYFVMFDRLEADAPRSFDWVLYHGNGLKETAIDGQTVSLPQTTSGHNLFVHNGRAALTASFLAASPLAMTTETYTGAEGYGYYTKVSAGAAAANAQFVTVLRAAPVHYPGLYRATDLLPPADSSGKLVKALEAAGTQLAFYRSDEVGDYVTLEFEVEQAGTYDMSTLFIQSPSYGQVQASVDGVPLGSVYDGYAPDVQAAAPFGHGTVTLAAGTHTIRYEVVGKNVASDQYFIGIDAIRLEEVGAPPPPGPDFVKELDAQLVQQTGVTGAKVTRPDQPTVTDVVLFRTGSGSYAAESVSSDAEQAVVTYETNGDVLQLAMTRGTEVAYDGTVYVRGDASFSAAMQLDAVQGGWGGWIESAQPLLLQVHADAEPSAVVLNGSALAGSRWLYDPYGSRVVIALPAGSHQLQLEG